MDKTGAYNWGADDTPLSVDIVVPPNARPGYAYALSSSGVVLMNKTDELRRVCQANFEQVTW